MADVYTSNAKWVKHIEDVFVIVDFNKKGFMSLEDWELWVDNIQRDLNPDPALVKNLREVMREYCQGIGLKPGVQLTPKQFVQKFAVFAAVEKAKYDMGEEPFLFKLNHAWYNVVDTNHDGTITLDEYTKVTKACNFGDDAASVAFETIDKNHNGKLERKELNEHEFKFWFTVEDTGTDGMFGEMLN